MSIASDGVLFAFPILTGLGSAYLFARDARICGGLRPRSQPPGIVFAIVWPILYVLIGLSLAIYWRKSGRQGTPLLAFFVALILGLEAWYLLATRFCAPYLAFAALAVLAAGFITIAAALRPVSTTATLALLPLILWLLFASYLMLEIASGNVVKKESVAQ